MNLIYKGFDLDKTRYRFPFTVVTNQTVSDGDWKTAWIKKKPKIPKGTVEFLLLPNRDGSGWQYVNLTDGHICPCKFASKEEAVKEFAKGVGDGIVGYMQIGDVEVKR